MKFNRTVTSITYLYFIYNIIQVADKVGTKLMLRVKEVKWNNEVKVVRTNLRPKVFHRRVTSVQRFVLTVSPVITNVRNFCFLRECRFPFVELMIVESFRIFLTL